MIDFHSHILPNVDDGAEDIDMTLEMLRVSYESGVRTVVSTSHCYPREDKQIAHFAARRGRRFKLIEEAVKEKGAKIPEIITGAEVNLITDFSHFEGIESLCIGDTRYILVEMPWKKWNDDIFDSVYNLKLKGFRPVIAHIDRYTGLKKEFANFEAIDAVFQLNADCFLTGRGRVWAYNLIKSGMGHIIGSDMHDNSMRPTRLKKAYEIINKYFGEEYVEYFKENGERVLRNEEIDKKRYKGLKELKKLSLIF